MNLIRYCRGYAAIFAMLLVFFVFSAAPFRAVAAMDDDGEGEKLVNPHDFGARQYCHLCHTAQPPALSFDPVTTCTKCHMGDIDNHPVSGHPIGVEPKINIPRNLPLTGDGRMVCQTCHDPHNRLRHKKMLRVDYEKICAACHAGY